jgi:hypothetical protein
MIIKSVTVEEKSVVEQEGEWGESSAVKEDWLRVLVTDCDYERL